MGNLNVYIKNSTAIYKIYLELCGVKNKPFLNSLSCDLGSVEIVLFCPET